MMDTKRTALLLSMVIAFGAESDLEVGYLNKRHSGCAPKRLSTRCSDRQQTLAPRCETPPAGC